MKSYAPEVLKYAALSYEEGKTDNIIYKLDKEAFSGCPSISIDYAIMEHTQKAATVSADIGWNDIGSFESLHAATQNQNGMALTGDVIIKDCENMFVHSDGPLICAVGVSNLAITVSDGKILIANLDQSQNVRLIVDDLKSKSRIEDL